MNAKWLEKIIVNKITNGDIRFILFNIKKKFDKKVYHKERKACITIEYWIKLYLLEMRNAVSENRSIDFIFPPKRHDMRCSMHNKLQSNLSEIKC